jgi:hypothetical protein|tara:strand:- start:256 stop:486 length:231 start_codon:yes stop_codon:yes gene_type:complete
MKTSLTVSQLNDIGMQYANRVVDSMTRKEMEQMIFEQIALDTCKLNEDELEDKVNNYELGLYDELVNQTINKRRIN